MKEEVNIKIKHKKGETLDMKRHTKRGKQSTLFYSHYYFSILFCTKAANKKKNRFQFEGSSDLNYYLKNCSKMFCTVFTGYSSWSKALFRSFKVGAFGHFVETDRLLKMAKNDHIWSKKCLSGVQANGTIF